MFLVQIVGYSIVLPMPFWGSFIDGLIFGGQHPPLTLLCYQWYIDGNMNHPKKKKEKEKENIK